MCKIYYALQMADDQPQVKVVEQLPNFIQQGSVVYEVDDEVFPLKSKEETVKYLSTLYRDPLHTKVLPGFISHNPE